MSDPTVICDQINNCVDDCNNTLSDADFKSAVAQLLCCITELLVGGGGGGGEDLELLGLADDDGAGTVTPFVRRIVRDALGVYTVTDTLLDGTTPYVVSGTVQNLIDNGDVLPMVDNDGAGTKTSFLRFYRSNGGVPSTLDTELDGATLYIPSGTVELSEHDEIASSSHNSLDYNSTGQLVNAGYTEMKGYHFYNDTNATIWVKLYNKVTAPLFTDIPVETLGIPAEGSAISNLSEGGSQYLLGLGIRATTGIADADVINPAANGLSGVVRYK